MTGSFASLNTETKVSDIVRALQSVGPLTSRRALASHPSDDGRMTKLDESEVDFWREVTASLEVIFGSPNPIAEAHDARLEQANLELQQLARAQDIDADGWRIEDRDASAAPTSSRFVVTSPAGERFELVDSVGIQKLGV